MATIFLAPTANFIQKTLSGAITDSADTITLNNVTNLTAPGYAVINRVNSAGTATPNSREVVFYTDLSGSDLTGVTRGADGSTNRAHGDSSIVEFTPTVGMWNSLATVVSTGFTGDGYLKAVSSPVSLAILHTGTRIALSGASVTGILTGINMVFGIMGSLSGATTEVAPVLPMPQAGTVQWVTVTSRHPVSTSSLVIDVNKNYVSIFAAGTRPAIPAGGTFVSTASIATKAFAPGNVYSTDVDAVGTDGFAKDITVLVRGE